MGVRYASILLTVIWIIYVFGAFFGGSSISNGVWAVNWCILNIACFAAVLYGLEKNNMFFLIPALCLSIFDIVGGLVNVLVNFITLNWFAAIWLLAIFALTVFPECVFLAIVALTVYYAMGLVTLLDSLDNGDAAEEQSAPSSGKQDGVLHV